MTKALARDSTKIAALLGSIFVVVGFAVWRISGITGPGPTPAGSPDAPPAVVAPTESAAQLIVIPRTVAASVVNPFREVLPPDSADKASSPLGTQLVTSDSRGLLPTDVATQRGLIGALPAPAVESPVSREEQDVLTLKGLVSTCKSGIAVLQFGNRQFVVRAGDLTAGGYRVSKVTEREVDLVRNGSQTVLRIDAIDVPRTICR